MARTQPVLLALIVTASTFVATGQTPAPKITVFTGGRLIAGDGTGWVEESVFIVEGTRFGQIGQRGQVKIPPGAVHVNLTGKTVIPALIDTYTHLGDSRETVVEQLQRRAYYGAGVVADLGFESGDVAFQFRDEEIPNAARLLTPGRAITADAAGSNVSYRVGSEADARTAVQELAAKHADVVNLWVSGGKHSKLSPQLSRAVVDEAHARGLRVIAHISTLQDAKDLLRAGVDGLADGIQDQAVDQEVVTLFKQHPNTVYVPNLPDPGFATDLSWLGDSASPAELKQAQVTVDRSDMRAAFELQHANMTQLHYLGIRIALGSGSREPWGHQLEIEAMGSGGKKGAMVPIDVISAASRNAADLLGLKNVGAIKPGNLANFLVLEGNAGLDLQEIRHIASMYLAGNEVDRAGLSAQRRRSP